jgi:hypothetical protein
MIQEAAGERKCSRRDRRIVWAIPNVRLADLSKLAGFAVPSADEALALASLRHRQTRATTKDPAQHSHRCRFVKRLWMAHLLMVGEAWRLVFTDRTRC